MAWRNVDSIKHCRWCGKSYVAVKPVGKDGFHSKACKQAHYRAYKNYVTAKRQARSTFEPKAVTRKKRK